MRVIFVLYLVSASCVCNGRPVSDKDARILEQIHINDEFGYKFAYATSNGISQTEIGEIVHPGADNEILIKRGYFSYTDPNNVPHIVQYTADENGFRTTITTNETSIEGVKNNLAELPDRIGTKLLITLSGGGG